MIRLIKKAPIKCIAAKVNVIINELVKVKEKGINPKILLRSINENKNKMEDQWAVRRVH